MTSATPVLFRRRAMVGLAAASFMVAAAPSLAAAQSSGEAQSARFIEQTVQRLVTVVNGPGSAADKRQEMQEIIDSAVDVDGVARFCLGRFWNDASPEQRADYTKLFHEVLVNNITSKLGDYKGVSVTVNRTSERGDDDIVNSTVNRPNNPPTSVDWVVSSGTPKIIDVIAEGTSLRLTQRQDYMSYLVHNGNSVDRLIHAIREQAAQNS
jgi:phospholipid transport system substrate-binding protein